jgi:hypothetical protein
MPDIVRNVIIRNVCPNERVDTYANGIPFGLEYANPSFWAKT